MVLAFGEGGESVWWGGGGCEKREGTISTPRLYLTNTRLLTFRPLSACAPCPAPCPGRAEGGGARRCAAACVGRDGAVTAHRHAHRHAHTELWHARCVLVPARAGGRIKQIASVESEKNDTSRFSFLSRAPGDALPPPPPGSAPPVRGARSPPLLPPWRPATTATARRARASSASCLATSTASCGLRRSIWMM